MVAVPNPQPQLDRHWGWLIAPALAAIYPTLALFAGSVREATWPDVVICGVVIVAATIAVAYLLRIVYSGIMCASVAAVVLVVWCFAFSSYMRVGRFIIEPIGVSKYNDYILYGFWMLLIFPLMILLWRFPRNVRRMEQLYKFVLLACVASVGLAAAKGVAGFLEVGQIGKLPVSIWGRESETMPAEWKPGPMAQRRDIYYVLLDRYGSEQSLRQFFGFDNSKFCDELEKRGFLVDRQAVTSYPMTSTSMASTLNMRTLNSRVEDPARLFRHCGGERSRQIAHRSRLHILFFGKPVRLFAEEHDRATQLDNIDVAERVRRFTRQHDSLPPAVRTRT